MIKKYLNPQNDIAFKHIFGKEKNKDILLALLNNVLKTQLHRPIKEAKFLPRVQDPETAAKKTSAVDLMCKDEDGCLYIIEMQVAKSEGFRERAQYYAAKAYINQAGVGGKYQDLEKVIFLAFTNYPVFSSKKNHKSDHQILDIITHEQDFDRLAFTIVDLVKFDKQNTKPLSELTLEEKFYYFLSHAQDITPQDLEMIIHKEPIIAQAFKALDRYYWTDEELQMYEQEEKKVWDYKSAEYQRGIDEGEEKGKKEGIKLGKKEGIKLGKKEGVSSTKIQIAQEMLAKGMDTKLIQELTGLSTEELKRLKAEL